VGRKYWKLFVKQHKKSIHTKCSEKYASNQTEWSTYSNFAQMYDECYQHMVMAGVAIELPEPVCMNKAGEEVPPDDQLAYSLPVRHELIHPDWLLFMDKMGINTNQKEDGHNGGEKYVCPLGTTPKVACATNNHHATIIPFVSASSHTVICVIVFQGESNKTPSS